MSTTVLQLAHVAKTQLKRVKSNLKISCSIGEKKSPESTWNISIRLGAHA